MSNKFSTENLALVSASHPKLTILVWAAMKLLGDANWYMPEMLNWLPGIQVEGRARPAAVPVTIDAD